MNTGWLTAQDFVRVSSTEAAQVFNVYPRKGVIAPGSDADVILFDANVLHTITAQTHHSRMDTNVYEGLQVRGKVRSSVCRRHCCTATFKFARVASCEELLISRYAAFRW